MNRIMKIVAVFHSDKVEGLDTFPQELQANPPMTISGMVKIHALIPQLMEERIQEIYSSLLARGPDTASVIALALGKEIYTLRELGQHSNKDGTRVIAYPGFEGEGFSTWQTNAMEGIEKIHVRSTASVVAITSHRPVIAGLIAFTRGIASDAGIKAVRDEPQTTEGGYRVFEYDRTKLTLIK